DGIGEGTDVVVDADEAFERREAVPVVEAVDGGERDREDHEAEEDDEGGAGAERDRERRSPVARRAGGAPGGGRARGDRGPGRSGAGHVSFRLRTLRAWQRCPRGP